MDGLLINESDCRKNFFAEFDAELSISAVT
jgi:hypothetical protein